MLKVETAKPRESRYDGYIEEEHIIRGTADLYRYDEAWNTVPGEQAIPFVTRILVRRPIDGATGDVILEALHPAGDMASSWTRTGRAVLRNRWTWVGVTQDVAGLAATKARNPAEYAELDIPKAGMGYDIVSQVARWLRSGEAPFTVNHLFMTGASYTGTFQRVFMADGFHARTRRPGGGPAIEGYLIQISSGAFMLGGYNAISPENPVPPAGNWRRTIQPRDVPVIELLSEGEAETNRDSRRDDSDEPGDRYRLYEVPGACHMSSGELDANPMAPTVEEPADFPMYALVGGALANLRRWAIDGIAPPRAPRLQLLGSRDDGRTGLAAESLPVARDEHGNAIGGVRTPHVDVPIAAYYPHSTMKVDASVAPPGGRMFPVGELMGAMTRFSPERLRALYGTPEEYQRRYGEGVDRLLAESWIEAADVDQLKAYANSVRF